MRGFSPRPDGVHGVVHVPGSKSHANRAIVCAALAEGRSELIGVPDGDDTRTMLDALPVLGVAVSIGPRSATISGPLPIGDGDEVTIWAGLGGTTSRFLTALASLRTAPTVVDGGDALRSRPMGPLHDALRALGHEVRAMGERGRLPVRVSRAAAGGGTVRVAGDVSSQFLSALMLTGPVRPGGLEVIVEGPLVSRPYVDMTTAVMRAFGAGVRWTASDAEVRCEIESTGYRPIRVSIEPDASSAAYGAAAVAIAGGSVRLAGLGRAEMQSDIGFLEVLRHMGCTVERDGDDVVVERHPSARLRAVDADLGSMSDQVPTLAAVAAVAEGTTRITGVGFVRSKESDRLGDLSGELARLGVRTEVFDDGITVRGGTLRPGRVDPHDDHRLAMSLALLGLRIDGIEVSEPMVVAKSWPSFWERIDAL